MSTSHRCQHNKFIRHKCTDKFAYNVQIYYTTLISFCQEPMAVGAIVVSGRTYRLHTERGYAMKAIRIKMKENSNHSNNPKNIEGFYIDDGNELIFYTVCELVKLLKNDPNKIIYVGDDCSSRLVSIAATNGTGYIRSIPNLGMVDAIMRLPRD